MIPYAIALKDFRGKSGIYCKNIDECMLNKNQICETSKLTGDWCKSIWIGLYFSLYSAFSIGWHDFNFGEWIQRLQTNDHKLLAAGWVRTVAGLQSLISLYLIAIWALTYFGRPFE